MSDIAVQQPLDEFELQTYLRIIKRRKWWVALTTVFVFAAASVVIARLPNFYKAETTILVDPQKVPDSLVPSTASVTVADRLSTVRQEVMSPTRLKLLIERTGLYADERAKGREDEVILKMQKSILLEVLDSGGSRLSAFKISYTGRTAQEAAAVPNQLAAMVMAEKLKAEASQSSGTAEFLDTELQETKKQLELKEAEMGRIKAGNILDLPESKQFHLEALTSLRSRLEGSQDRVNRAQQEKVYLQSMMAGSNPTVDLDADGGGSTSSPEQVQLQKLETRLSELRMRYGPRHPDVLKTQNEIEKLQGKIAEQKKAEPQQTEAPRVGRRIVHNPVLEAQIAKIDQEIQEQTKLQQDLQGQIDFHASKLEHEPIFEQKIAGLMRDYDSLRDHYNHLLDKKLGADMYNALQNRQEAERFVVLDPASVPTKPAGPNRFLFGLFALIGGFLAGIGLAVAAELADESVRDEKEAANLLGKPIIATIPVIMDPEQMRWVRIRAAGLMTITAAGAVCVGFVISVFVTRLV